MGSPVAHYASWRLLAYSRAACGARRVGNSLVLLQPCRTHIMALLRSVALYAARHITLRLWPAKARGRLWTSQFSKASPLKRYLTVDTEEQALARTDAAIKEDKGLMPRVLV